MLVELQMTEMHGTGVKIRGLMLYRFFIHEEKHISRGNVEMLFLYHNALPIAD